eukprot:COSAG04_NODE_1665_length_6011_cov_3.395467_2_plen_273_part_00
MGVVGAWGWGLGVGMLLLSVLLLIALTSPPTTTSTGPPPSRPPRSSPAGPLPAGQAAARACPCSPSSLCSSLSPQPPHDRQEVLAFHVPGFYTNPTTHQKPEPYYFNHYPWGNVTTVAPFVGREGAPGDEPPNWDTSGSTAELVCTAHQHNARVVGHLGHGSVQWPQVVNASWRTEWVSDITHWFIEEQGMDGIQFDVEALNPNETAAATDLVCELRAALNTALPGSTLSWCSDFPPSADPGWNFTRLGECLDHFVIMVLHTPHLASSDSSL